MARIDQIRALRIRR